MTNLNRQIIATHKTIGRAKVEVAKERILEINPDAHVEALQEFFLPESKTVFDNTASYIIDCVDTVTAKIEIIVRAKKLGVPVISCMGTGNKLNPMAFEVSDINKTSVCPLAKVIRKELRQRNIDNVKVVYSKEEPKKCECNERTPGSISFVPSVAGLIIASEVIKNVIEM